MNLIKKYKLLPVALLMLLIACNKMPSPTANDEANNLANQSVNRTQSETTANDIISTPSAQLAAPNNDIEKAPVIAPTNGDELMIPDEDFVNLRNEMLIQILGMVST